MTRETIFLNRHDHPAKTRVLCVLRAGESMIEARVVEWSLCDNVKLEFSNGDCSWQRDPPYLVEVLDTTASVDRRFSGELSKPLWNAINRADTLEKLRDAVYLLACTCQDQEG